VRAIGDSALFLLLNSVTVMLIVVLVFLITRNFWKVLAERRRGTLGSHLNLKFVAAFILIAFLPTTGLLLVSGYFITSSLENWFGLHVEHALEESEQVAQSAYAASGENALHFGAQIAEQITQGRLLREESLDALQELEGETSRRVHAILQLRLHPAIQALKAQAAEDSARKSIELTYITTRGPWYFVSWKGDESESGGVVTNIGIHFFDMLSWIYGAPRQSRVFLLLGDPGGEGRRPNTGLMKV